MDISNRNIRKNISTILPTILLVCCIFLFAIHCYGQSTVSYFRQDGVFYHAEIRKQLWISTFSFAIAALVAGYVAFNYEIPEILTLTVPALFLLFTRTIFTLYFSTPTNFFRQMTLLAISLIAAVFFGAYFFFRVDKLMTSATLSPILIFASVIVFASAICGIVLNKASGSNVGFINGVTLAEAYKLIVILVAAIGYTAFSKDRRMRRLFYCTLVLPVLLFEFLSHSIGDAVITACISAVIVLTLEAKQLSPRRMACLLVAGVTLLFAAAIIAKILMAGNSYMASRLSSVGSVLDDFDCYPNQARALFSMTSGGIFGTGINDKAFYAICNYASTSDYAFCTYSSVWGIAMGLSLILCYAAIFLACRAKNSHYTGNGFCLQNICAVYFAVQSIIHILGNLNIIPFTGVELPLISSGGLSCMCALVLIASQLGLRLGSVFLSDEEELRYQYRIAKRLYPIYKLFMSICIAIKAGIYNLCGRFRAGGYRLALPCPKHEDLPEEDEIK